MEGNGIEPFASRIQAPVAGPTAPTMGDGGNESICGVSDQSRTRYYDPVIFYARAV
jgi:hypothetical protein